MSTSIPSTGLFVEAAFGVEGVPGQSGILGVGEASDLAWQQAMNAAIQGQASTQEAGIPAPQFSEDSTTLEPNAGMNDPSLKENHPMTWDRLSMTVSSMVAWSMQVEMSEDEIAEPLTPSELSEVLNTGDHELGDLLGRTTDAAIEGEFGANQSVSLPIGASDNLMSNSVEPSVQMYSQGAPTESLADVIRPVIEVAASAGMQDDLVAKSADPTPPISGIREADVDRVPEPNTTSQTIPMQAVQAQPTSNPTSAEIPTNETVLNASVDVEPVQKEQGKVTTTVTPVSKSVDVDNLDEALQIIRHVRSSSVEGDALQSGRERLQGVRAVLNELETSFDLKTMSDVINRTPVKEAVRIANQPNFAAESVSRNPTTNPVLKSGVSLTNQPVTQGHVPSEHEDTGMGGEGLMASFEEEADLNVQSDRRSAIGVERRNDVARTNKESVTPQGNNTSTDMKVELMGAENVEITSDQEQLVETAMEDGQNIEASEIPELAVQDVSNLDIDIDDPMGTVRLAMTKEAEEVSVRLETPQEVLEEYREMQEEIDERLARQGLDLGQFSADAHGNSGDNPAPEEPVEESNQAEHTAATSGDETLATEGTSARLVNRIV